MIYELHDSCVELGSLEYHSSGQKRKRQGRVHLLPLKQDVSLIRTLLPLMITLLSQHNLSDGKGTGVAEYESSWAVDGRHKTVNVGKVHSSCVARKEGYSNGPRYLACKWSRGIILPIVSCFE